MFPEKRRLGLVLMKNDMIPMRKIKGKEINVKVEVPKGEKHDREDQRNKQKRKTKICPKMFP